MRILPLPLLLCGLMLLSSVNEINGHRTYCPHGWRLIHGRCFKYVPRRMTWIKAERNCISMGGNLASVHSSDEYHGIQGLILQVTHEMREAWIGGTDAAEENHWHWSDGTLMTFTYWCPGEPNNAAYRQDCMQMNDAGEKCWDDYTCTVRLPSVCVLKK